MPEPIFVKDWVRANQLTVFKLSNSVYQAIFPDKSEFLMCSNAQAILFISKERKRYPYRMKSENLLKSRPVMVRLEYFKAVLRGWVCSDDSEIQKSDQKRKRHTRAVSKMLINGLGIAEN